MADPLEFAAGAVGVIFGAGVAWASLKERIKASAINAETARQQADDALSRLAVEKERSTKQDGKLDLYNERIGNLRRDVDELRAAIFKSRIESRGSMAAVRPDERRDDTDPPPVPAPRPRAPSYRRE